MDELNDVTEHFKDMARGKVSYSRGFRVIKQVPINIADRSLSSKPLITAISTAQAAVEENKGLVKEKAKSHKKKTKTATAKTAKSSKEAF